MDYLPRINYMAPHRFLLIALLTACVDSAPEETELAESDTDALLSPAGKSDASWDGADTLHANTRLFDYAGANERRIHSLWIAGSNMNRVPLEITARAQDGFNVRVAVLGPIVNGKRAVLAAAGYSSAQTDVTIALDVATRGEHLVVVGSHNLATETSYELTATCGNCESRVDILSNPKTMALVGNEQNLLSMELGDVMTGRTHDVQVDVYASSPMQWWNGVKVATAVASGNQVNAIIPSSVKPGDDLRLVVREPGGRTLDTGVLTRYVPTPTAFARLDAILYGDIASLQIAGVVGFFEGQADLRLFSETKKRTLADHTQHAEAAGQQGIGFGAFDATFMPDYSVAAADGELLSVGFINGNGDYKRLGCFEYCNNLSGMSSCTGGARPCPTAP